MITISLLFHWNLYVDCDANLKLNHCKCTLNALRFVLLLYHAWDLPNWPSDDIYSSTGKAGDPPCEPPWVSIWGRCLVVGAPGRTRVWGKLGNLLGQLPPLLMMSPGEHTGWTKVLHVAHLICQRVGEAAFKVYEMRVFWRISEAVQLLDFEDFGTSLLRFAPSLTHHCAPINDGRRVKSGNIIRSFMDGQKCLPP